MGRDTFYPFPFEFHPKQSLRLSGQRDAIPKPVSSHNWLCLGTTDAEVGVHQQKVSVPQRESDSQEHRSLWRLQPELYTPPPLFVPVEIISPKWPIISASMIFFSHLLKAFPSAHLHFFSFVSKYLISSLLYFAIN